MSTEGEIVVVAQAAEGKLAHFPDAVRLADGRLLAAYREGAGHLSADGRIVLVESADEGCTWSSPRVVVDGPCDDRDPKIMQTRDGTVLLSYFVIDWTSAPEHAVLGTYVLRSRDGGRTWSERVRVGSAMDGGAERAERGYLPGWAASHGAVVELPDGDLLIPLYGTLPTQRWQRATVVRSGDGGQTWSAATEATLAAADGMHFQEPTLTVLPDGQAVALIRTTVGFAYLSRSVDGGRTWSPPVATDLPASSHHALSLTTGEVLITYGDTSRRFSPRRHTTGRLVRRPEESWDGWPDVPLYDSGHEDQANPSSVELAPGRYLTLSFDIVAATVVGIFTRGADYPIPEGVASRS